MEFRPLSYARKLLSRATGGPVWTGGPGDIVLTLTTDGEILEISPSADDVIGAAGNLVGRSLFDFVRREDRARVRTALGRADDGDLLHVPGELRTEFRLLRLRRAPASAEITFGPAKRGKLTALIRERGAEFALQREARAEAETAAAEHAIDTAEAEGTISADLLADLGHELKTPLNAIMGFAETMRAETFGPLGDPKYAEYTDYIHSSGAHLLELIGVMLDAAKVEAGRYALSPSLTEPGALGRECAEMVRGEAEKAGLKLSVEIEPGLPETMLDARAVRQILINLLSNAVKFTAHGEVALSVSEKCGAIDFIVRDTGVGMNKIALSKIGARYTDVHKNGVRGAKGSGLGLSLAFSLAKLHGGALKIDSSPGEGTVATLTIPVRKNLAEFNSQAPEIRETATSGGDIQSQLDRVNAYRRERMKANAA